MKMIAYALACLMALSSVLAIGCYDDVSAECAQSSSSLALAKCNAMYGDYTANSKANVELQAYANLHIKLSYEYLLSASYFNNYAINRAGFSKLFRKLSDDAWEKSIDLIKHVTMRGGTMDFSQRSTHDPKTHKTYTVELHEMASLAKALDTQKELAERAFWIHQEVARKNEALHDPEVMQYLEEKFIEDQAKTIRNLAGYTNDAKNFASGNAEGLSLAMYIFDEYLQKVV